MSRIDWKKFKDKLNVFLDSPYYLLALGLVIFLFWAFEIQYVAMAALVLLCCVLLVTGKCGKPFLAVVVMFIMCVSDIWHLNRTFWIFVAVVASVLGVCLIYRVVCILRRPKALTLGNLFGGLVVAFAVTMLGGVGYGYNLLHFVQTFGLCFAGFAFYFFFVNTLSGNLTRYVSQLAVISGVVVILEILAYYFKIYAIHWNFQDVLDSFHRKDINLAWALSNTAAVMLVMAIPLALYLSTNTKRNFLYILLAFVFGLGVLFTFSRGNLLFLAVMIIPMMAYTFYKTKYKSGFIYTTLAILICLLGAVIFFREQIEVALKFLLDTGFHSRGRIERYIAGIKYFLEAPLFGTGIFTVPDVDHQVNWYMVHSTTLQIMMNFGLVGLVGYAYFFWQRYRTFCKNTSKFKIFALFAVLLMDLHGLVDVTFYVIFYVFYIFIICIAAEKEPITECEPAFRAKSLRKGIPVMKTKTAVE